MEDLKGQKIDFISIEKILVDILEFLIKSINKLGFNVEVNNL
jgi:hypothetical protein